MIPRKIGKIYLKRTPSSTSKSPSLKYLIIIDLKKIQKIYTMPLRKLKITKLH